MFTPADSRSARGTVLVWDSTGSYLGRLGSPGDGPGELAPNFAPTIYIGLGDSIYVDEFRRWSLFDPDLRFVRILRASQIGVSGAATVVPTDAGWFLSAGGVRGGDTGFWFHLSDAGGALIRSFGPRANAAQSGPPTPRPIGYAGGDTFWAAPPAGSSLGYVLEEWSLSGERVRAIRRKVPWIHPAFNDERLGRYPRFIVHVDAEGLLWVTLVVRDPRWRSVETLEELMQRSEELLDSRIEVIDPEAGVVLASALVDDPYASLDDRRPPGSWIQGTRETSHGQTDSLGFRNIQLVRWHLVAR